MALQFSPRSLRLTIDDNLLWYDTETRPGGPLRRVELACRAEKDAKIKGAAVWSEFAVTRAVDEMPHPVGDLTQDELWLATGDQLFGTITRADRQAVEFQSQARKRSIPWSDLRGCFFRKASIPPLTTTGEHVRVVLPSTLSKTPDLLDAVLVKLDDTRVLLRPIQFGEIAINRLHIQELKRLFKGADRRSTSISITWVIKIASWAIGRCQSPKERNGAVAYD